MAEGASAWRDTLPQTEPRVIRAWRCMPPVERGLCVRFANVVDSFSPYIAELTVDVEMIFNFPLWWERRKKAFVGNYQLQRFTVTVGGVDISAYMANRQWMRDVKDGLQRGVIADTTAYCYQRDFVNAPE